LKNPTFWVKENLVKQKTRGRGVSITKLTFYDEILSAFYQKPGVPTRFAMPKREILLLARCKTHLF
jgi:hypothetical protein